MRTAACAHKRTGVPLLLGDAICMSVNIGTVSTASATSLRLAEAHSEPRESFALAIGFTCSMRRVPGGTRSRSRARDRGCVGRQPRTDAGAHTCARVCADTRTGLPLPLGDVARFASLPVRGNAAFSSRLLNAANSASNSAMSASDIRGSLLGRRWVVSAPVVVSLIVFSCCRMRRAPGGKHSRMHLRAHATARGTVARTHAHIHAHSCMRTQAHVRVCARTCAHARTHKSMRTLMRTHTHRASTGKVH